MSGFVPLIAGYAVPVRRTRLGVLVVLTLAVTVESPICCILREGIHTPLTRAIEASHAACKAEL